MMSYIRHTMGNDWGGRRKQNPEGCPKVTWKDVFAYVASRGIHVKWGGPTAVENGTWWYWSSDDRFQTAGTTNYLCMEFLKSLQPSQWGIPPELPEDKQD